MGVISSGVLAGLAKIGLVVVSIGGLSAGAYFAYQVGPGGDGDDTTVLAGATVPASPTALLATLTPTAEPPTPQPTPSPSSTALPPTPTQPPAPTATPDPRVPMGEIPTADQIQLGKDGKYFIADRGDGCMWVEHQRDTHTELGDIVFLSTDCPVTFGYVYMVKTGEVSVLIS